MGSYEIRRRKSRARRSPNLKTSFGRFARFGWILGPGSQPACASCILLALLLRSLPIVCGPASRIIPRTAQLPCLVGWDLFLVHADDDDQRADHADHPSECLGTPVDLRNDLSSVIAECERDHTRCIRSTVHQKLNRNCLDVTSGASLKSFSRVSLESSPLFTLFTIASEIQIRHQTPENTFFLPLISTSFLDLRHPRTWMEQS